MNPNLTMYCNTVFYHKVLSSSNVNSLVKVFTVARQCTRHLALLLISVVDCVMENDSANEKCWHQT